jgi:hypothetical protein
VQQNAEGYYINNFALNTNKNDALQNQRLTSLSALFMKPISNGQMMSLMQPK